MCGQRGKELYNDIMQFDVEAGIFITSSQSHVASSNQASTSLEPINNEKPCGLCYSSVDLSKGEIYVLIKDNLWMYSLTTNEFSMIHKSNTANCKESSSSTSESYARISDVNYFVHANNNLYVFKPDSEYTIQLRKPSRDSVFNYCKYLIRRQQYEEITRESPIAALSFLRINLSETIDKNDINQVNDFHKLASLLFCNKSSINYSTDGDVKMQDDEGQSTSSSSSACDGRVKMRNQRSILFNKLISLLPRAKCQPQQNLLNFINI